MLLEFVERKDAYAAAGGLQGEEKAVDDAGVDVGFKKPKISKNLFRKGIGSKTLRRAVGLKTSPGESSSPSPASDQSSRSSTGPASTGPAAAVYTRPSTSLFSKFRIRGGECFSYTFL